MAINLGTLYDRLFNLVNKDQSGNTFKPEQLNNDLQYVLYAYLKMKYGLPEQPNAPQAFEVVQKITDDIKTLKVWKGGPNSPLLQVDNKGRATFPEDYWHPASMFYTQTYKNSCGDIKTRQRRVQIVTEDERVGRLGDPLTEPTEKYPICCLYDDFIQFYPVGINYINFTYLRKPETPFFDYDIVNDKVVYLPPGEVHQNGSILPAGTPSRSVEMPVPDDVYQDIINFMLSDYGLAIRDGWVSQAGERRKTLGV